MPKRGKRLTVGRRRHRCNRCGWVWIGKPNPAECPRCKSYGWRTPSLRGLSKIWR